MTASSTLSMVPLPPGITSSPDARAGPSPGSPSQMKSRASPFASIRRTSPYPPLPRSTAATLDGLTALELTDTHRSSLLSKVFAVLADLYCTVIEAKFRTHNGQIAALIFIQDDDSGSPINDPHRIHRIEARLRHILKSDHDDVRGAKTAIVPSPSLTLIVAAPILDKPTQTVMPPSPSPQSSESPRATFPPDLPLSHRSLPHDHQ